MFTRIRICIRCYLIIKNSTQPKCIHLLLKNWVINSFFNNLTEGILPKLIMAQKRAHSLSEDDNEVMDFFKKVKVEQESISLIIKKKHPEIDIEEHKINKFLTIFNAVLESNLEGLKAENLDSEDGFTDIIKIVIVTVLELISKNIETLDLTRKIKNGLEKLKRFINKHGENRTSSQTTVSEGLRTVTTNNEQSSTTSADNSR